MKSVIPRANNAIFEEVGQTGRLKLNQRITDVPRPTEFTDTYDQIASDEHGYIQTLHGDSGSPVWFEVNNVGVTQHVLAAIVHGMPTRKPGGYYGSEPEFSCRNIVTKITEEMSLWLYKY